MDNGSAVSSVNINPFESTLEMYLDAEIAITESAFKDAQSREQFNSLLNLELAIISQTVREHYLAEYDRRHPTNPPAESDTVEP